jgi:hypothetical protein
MDILLKKIRETKDSPNQITSNIFLFIILIGLIAFGYYIFFFNPYKILNYVRAPLMITYILVTVFVLYFIFKRLKEKYHGGLDVENFLSTLIITTIMRLVGMVLRAVIIVIGIVVVVIFIVGGLLGFLAWLVLPFLTLWFLIISIIALTK